MSNAPAEASSKSDDGASTLSNRFVAMSNRMAALTGNYLTFALAAAVIIVWAISGPIFRFSNTWQLVINTGTTIVTFLMVFLIQNTQNRDAEAVHLKLDELIRAIANADNRVMAAEQVSETKLNEWRKQYAELTKDHEAIEGKTDSVASEIAGLKKNGSGAVKTR